MKRKYVYGRLLPLVEWWRRLWCQHHIVQGGGILYCTKCTWWEH